MASVLDPILWACRVPPMKRKNGRIDDTAHHVLLALATFADADGTNARPSSAALADRSYLADETAQAALRRIETAGLIERAGTKNGVPVWRLRLEIRGESVVVSEQEEARARRRAKNAERQKRYRDARKSASGNAFEERDVTPSETVTDDDRNALGDRYVTPSDTVSNGAGPRYVTGSDGENLPYQPETNQKTKDIAPHGADEDQLVFDAEIVDDAYGRHLTAVPDPAPAPKSRKGKTRSAEETARFEQAQYLAKGYYDATKGMGTGYVPVLKIVEVALGQFDYESVRMGLWSLAAPGRGRKPVTKLNLLSAIEAVHGASGTQQSAFQIPKADRQVILAELDARQPDWPLLAEYGITPDNAAAARAAVLAA